MNIVDCRYISTANEGICPQCLVLIYGVDVFPVAGQQQSFRVAPNDTSVIQGNYAMLECVVDNMKGALQWTKDGFALGQSHVLNVEFAGFKRIQLQWGTLRTSSHRTNRC